jgi:hypothetical protein
MNIDHRNPRLRRGFAFVALAAVLGLSAVGLTQCRMVDDTVTGVDMNSSSTFNARSACVHQCNAKYKACKKSEEALYKQNRKQCEKLPHADRAACLKAEKARHKAAQKECTQQMQKCKRNCYREGAGSAGR